MRALQKLNQDKLLAEDELEKFYMVLSREKKIREAQNQEQIDAALADVKAGKAGPIPRQLQNKHYDGEDAEVKGQNYKYPHSYPNAWVEQQYLPDSLKNAHYYEYGNNKNEQAHREYWSKIKGSNK